MKSNTPSTAARVKRCRDKRAGVGLTRVELYLDRRTLDAVHRYAKELGEYRSSVLTSMVVTGLCFEGRMSHPWHSRRIVERIQKYFR
jgi:hypothetical protein